MTGIYCVWNPLKALAKRTPKLASRRSKNSKNKSAINQKYFNGFKCTKSNPILEFKSFNSSKKSKNLKRKKIANLKFIQKQNYT